MSYMTVYWWAKCNFIPSNQHEGLLGLRRGLIPAEMEKGDASTVRIYVGGLGESVTAEDLRKTFSTPQLGKVESMDIVRTKGRSFAYLDLLPSSEKSLPKLFSTYNGCMWKGGRLRIEKAKEHFSLRLKREWEEDAALATNSPNLPVTEPEMTKSMKYQKKGSKLDEMQLRIYFPRLGKLKPVLLRGTGKHKYSFQRVEVPLLPTHFCDCEEHSGHPDATKQKSFCDYNFKDGGMDEKELNIMNSVLNKIFERENYSEQAPSDFNLAKEIRSTKRRGEHFLKDKNPANQEMEDDNADDRTTKLKDPSQEEMTVTQVNENCVELEMDDDDDDDDDDDLIINAAVGPKDKTTMFIDPSREPIAAIQILSKESQHATDKQRQGWKVSSNTKKREAPSENENGEAHTLPSKLPKKSPWKDLVCTSSGATFSVLDILPNAEILHCGSEGVSVSPEKMDGEVSNECEEPDKVTEHSNDNLNGNVDFYARGAAWRQKSSWTQLIRDTTTSFSISQILPGLPKPELPLMGETGNMQKSSRSDLSDSQDVATSVPGISSGVSVVEKEQKNVHFSEELPVLDNYQQKENVKIEASTPTLEKQHLSAPKQASVGDTNLSKTCSFMRSAASMKEWAKMKAALSGSLKNKSKEKR